MQLMKSRIRAQHEKALRATYRMTLGANVQDGGFPDVETDASIDEQPDDGYGDWKKAYSLQAGYAHPT